MVTHRQRLWGRLLLVGILAGFAVQFIITSKYGEPFPAISMPAFHGAGEPGVYQVTNGLVELQFPNSSPVQVPLKDFIDEFPQPHRGTVGGQFRGVDGEVTAKPFSKSDWGIIKVFPHWRWGEWHQRDEATLELAREYFRAKGEEIADESPSRVFIRWSTNSYHPGELKPFATEPASTYELAL